MEIFRFQIKRILRAPFFLGLLAAFLAFDFYLISTAFGMRGEVNLINDVAGRTGVRIDAGFEQKFRPIVAEYSKDLAVLYRRQTGGGAAGADEMMQTLSQRYHTLTGEQQKRFRDDCTVLQLSDAVKNRGSSYRGYDITQAGRSFIRQGNVTGASAVFITRCCAALQDRMTQIRRTGEQDTLFFPGTVYGMHGFLYDTLFRAIIAESAVLGVLVVFGTVNYEFAHGTQSLAYTSRRGRRFAADQFRASMLAAMLVPVLLMAAVLTVFFGLFHFSNVWGSYVSSAMNAERNKMQVLPYVTLWPLTVLQYLWVHVGLALVQQAVFCLLAFAAALFFRNSYAGVLCCALGWMLLVNIPYVLPWNTVLPLVLWANPIVAWVNCTDWLTQVDLAAAYPQYHLLLFALGGAAAAALSFFGLRRFRRADL